MATASMRCPIPDDITLLYASSHYHSRGVGYGAWIDSTPTQLGDDALLHVGQLEQPAQRADVDARRGRHSCSAGSATTTTRRGREEYFQGQSALTNEMCMFIGLYYPDMGQQSRTSA